MNREPNREVQAWTSWVNQEVIGYTGKSLFFYGNLLGFAGNLLVFTKKFFILISYYYVVNINNTNLMNWGSKPMEFYDVVIVAVFELYL